MADADVDVEGEEVPWEDRRLMIQEYMASHFFEHRHFQLVAASLSACGDKRHVIAAAARLLAAFGVGMSGDDQLELMALSEEEQINALLAKIPQDGNEQFQDFFGKLQQLVVCSEKVRAGLEAGEVATVEEALSHAVSFGIESVVYRMAATQAGAERRSFGERLKEWGKDNAAKTGKLTRCQEEAMAARKKLAAAQAKLGAGRGLALQKSSRFVLHFAEGTLRGLGAVIFRSWQAAAAELKSERRLSGEFESRINDVKQRGQECKERQLRGARRLSVRQAATRRREVALDCFWSWQGAVRDRKVEEECAKKLQDFHVRLRRMKEAQVMNADSLLLKSATYSERALLQSCFQAFVSARREMVEEAAVKEQLQKSQEQIERFRQSKSSIAKRILREMCCCTDAGLVTEAWAAWVLSANQEREARALQEQLDEGQRRMERIRRRSKESGFKLAEKLRGQRELTALLEVLISWRLQSRLECKTRHLRVRVDAKRQQMHGVHAMFRSFATQLEYQLSQSQQSHRDGRLYKSRSVEMGLSEVPWRPAHSRRPSSRTKGEVGPAGREATADDG